MDTGNRHDLDPVGQVARYVEAEGPGLSLAHLVATLSHALDGAPVGLYDRAGRLLAAAPPPAEGSHRLPDHVAAQLARLPSACFGPQAQALEEAGRPPIGAAVPVVGAGRRLGTLLVRQGVRPLEGPERAAIRLAALAAGMALACQQAAEHEGETRARQLVRSALSSLSYSEALAVRHLLQRLQGDEGLLVTSRIADQAGVTRSVVVNALRKLASARLIESRSLGKRGTYLRLLSRELRDELLRPAPLGPGAPRRATAPAAPPVDPTAG